MTTAERSTKQASRRVLEPAARRAAARMVLAADKAAGRPEDPRVAAIAAGKQ